MANHIYKFFADYIYENIGIVYSENDYYRLESRLKELCKDYDASDIHELYDMFAQKITPEMSERLLDLATNNETYFLRDNKPFQALAKGIVPRILESLTPGLKVNIWSAGCSKGQEPYSILMSLLDQYGSLDKFELDATDICKEALAKAKSGNYTPLEVQRGLPIGNLIKYFTQLDDDSWVVKDELKNKVHFGEFNLFSGAFPVNKYHVIFCRNVIIYQNKENKEKIIKKLLTALRPDGYLILGSGESLIGIDVPYKQELIEGNMVFQKSEEDSGKKAA